MPELAWGRPFPRNARRDPSEKTTLRALLDHLGGRVAATPAARGIPAYRSLILRRPRLVGILQRSTVAAAFKPPKTEGIWEHRWHRCPTDSGSAGP
jgi:hypothetical protein